MKKAWLILLIGALVWSCSDKEDTPEDNTVIPQSLCDSLAPTYDGQIASILSASCAPCHITGSESGYNMASYTNAKNAAQSAKFLQAIKHESGASAMPKNGSKLSDENIQLVECWINNGYPEN